ncbi:MAG: sulfatase-like hydrolase/transferase [Pirellulales bacterium]|nr:sulfatase-like hydrolase/transferase [Pirellulales bacterium]
MNLLVIAVDRLHIGYLGCYGNSWIGTPGIDGFAAAGLVFDQVLVDSPRLGSLYTTYWRGVHAAAHAGLAPHQRRGDAALPARLTAAGYHTLLVTDDEHVARHRLAGGFTERWLARSPTVASTGRKRTSLERVFIQAGRRLTDARPPFCMWVHSRGLGAPWDAPLSRRRQYAEIDDPLPSDAREVPRLKLAADYDPDLLQGHRWAYAGQVTWLDDCLAAFTGLLDESGLADDTAVLFLSTRGFLLGEHGRVGARPPMGHEELIHVPWIWQVPGEDLAQSRSEAIVQPDDLAPTLAALLGVSDDFPGATGHNLVPLLRGEVSAVRDRAVTVCRRPDGEDRSEFALRTAAWHLRELRRPGRSSRELFVKPDDRWEQNEISSRADSVAEELEAALDAWLVAARQGQLALLPPLPAGC